MADFDDDAPAPSPLKTIHEIGQDLSRYSVAELTSRATALRSEIDRIEREIASKAAHLGAADQLFRR